MRLFGNPIIAGRAARKRERGVGRRGVHAEAHVSLLMFYHFRAPPSKALATLLYQRTSFGTSFASLHLLRASVVLLVRTPDPQAGWHGPGRGVRRRGGPAGDTYAHKQTMCLCVYIYIYIYVYIICSYVCIYIYIYNYSYRYIYTSTYTHTYMLHFAPQGKAFQYMLFCSKRLPSEHLCVCTYAAALDMFKCVRHWYQAAALR